MAEYNIPITQNIEDLYSQGLLPQRNSRDFFYKDTSSRSNLEIFSLSSENRRIINKTAQFTYQIFDINDFKFDINVQKKCFQWAKILSWDFPSSSIKNIFTNHIFNQVYVWYSNSEIVAYALVYKTNNISHIAYVFYDPQFSRDNLPIRIALEVVINSQKNGLKYCYLGRFSQEIGYYKRNMPGFQYYQDNNWVKFI